MALAPRKLWKTLVDKASEPVDLASLAFFRMAFGALVTFGAARFLVYDWVDRFFVRPTFFFKYFGFEWVDVASPAVMYGAFWALAGLGVLVTLGLFYRVAIVALFLLFSYVELLDVSNYLNHYYLVSLLAFLMIFMPLNGAWSLDAKLFKRVRRDHAPRLFRDVLRFQVGTVYVFAGLAKLGSDWLIHAQPLNIWLTSRVDTPIIGPFLDEWWVALAMAWAGFLYDSTIVGFLLWKRTRPFAYAVVLVFHFFTNVFFAIGLFPLIMTAAATIFFEADWPRRAFKLPAAGHAVRDRVSGWLVAGALIFASFHVLMPFRHLAYPGDVLWSEEGMRWSWKVMVREKNGAVNYRVYLPELDKELRVSPAKYLSSDQEREFAGQPDLILQLAHHVGEEWRAKGYANVEVRADAWVSLNGRPTARLLDPEVDLMKVDDGLLPAGWILPAPQTPPFRGK